MKTWIVVLFAVVSLVPRTAAASDDRSSAAKKDDDSKPPVVIVKQTESVVPEVSGPRPALLKSLYATSIGLQAFDGVSTFVGLRNGAREFNPAMQQATPTTLVVAKATMTLTTIAVAEQLWRTHHRGQAIAVMAISNGLMAVVAAKNASVLR